MADSADDPQDPEGSPTDPTAEQDATNTSDPADASTADSADASTADSADASTPESLDPAALAAHTTDRRTLSPSVQVIWAVRVFFGVAVVGVLGFVVAGQLNVDPGLVLAGLGVLSALGLVWVHLRYRVWSFRVREDALYLQRGVLTNVKTVAPHVRIQHVDTSRGPLERALGLSTLVVYTAGSRGADVSIPGLGTDEAADLQQRVKEMAIVAEGGDAL
ncbi:MULTISPECIES: PH domain-containing protein [Salinibaculum]|uniref:PH domain-containing protein n=1 Tax=Salinibaculum TaxID=2732368 RepID=UPI0030CF83EF